jgi:hypothetical protein
MPATFKDDAGGAYLDLGAANEYRRPPLPQPQERLRPEGEPLGLCGLLERVGKMRVDRWIGKTEIGHRGTSS